MIPIFRCVLCTLVCCLVGPVAALAQDSQIEVNGETMEFDQNTGVVTFIQNVTITGSDLDITCDQASHNRRTGEVHALGNVVIQRAGARLQADSVTYNTRTDDASATGNVVYEKGERVWRGDHVTYNFRTEKGSFPNLDTFYEPFHIISPRTEKVGQDHYRAYDAIITTCDPSDKEFYISARVADVYPGDRLLHAEGVWFHLNGVPFFYLPSWTTDLDREATNFDFLPGYSSRSGAFALMAYTWHLDKVFRTTTHLDLRSKRGVGGGQDLRWRKKDEFEGGIYAYVTQDNEPYKSVSQEERERAEGIDIEEPRWRLRLNHFQALSDVDNLFVELNKMGDQQVVSDFFDEEFRLAPEPENRVSWVHTERYLQYGIEVQRELNDEFFSKVNRQPEARLEVSRVRIGDTPFYYQNDNQAAFLEQSFNDLEQEQGSENFEAGRVFSEHEILMPNRFGGFLNVIPRVGYSGTYYTETRGQVLNITNVVSSVDTNDVTTLSTNVVEQITGGDAELRNLFTLGMETSFKAFKVLDEQKFAPRMTGLRHVVEPFADYEFSPEPNVRPGELLQFDEIDRLDERNDLRLGVRNKLQTKVARSFYDEDTEERTRYTDIWDLVDVEVAARLDLDPDEDQDTLRAIEFDAELRPSFSWALDVRGSYDPEAGELSRINTELSLFGSDDSLLGIEHTYLVDAHNVVQGEFELWPEEKFSLEGYSRYNLEDSEMEEQMILASYKTDCVGYGLGFRWLAGEVDPDTDEQDEDDIRVWFQIWLLAFPKSILQMGND